jgi:hypothetical protein
VRFHLREVKAACLKQKIVLHTLTAPNARHHPPRSPIDLLDSRRVRGRVHAVVRLRFPPG